MRDKSRPEDRTERIGAEQMRDEPRRDEQIRDEPRRDEQIRDETRRDDRAHESAAVRTSGDDAARDKFGGINPGAAIFGWLVSISVAVLLTSILGAVGTAVSANTQITRSQAERQAGTIGIVAAIVLLVVLMLGYYFGGYVAGRMSRFDGGRQGAAVWVIGLLVTIVAIALGAFFGNDYNILDRVSLPSIPISGGTLGLGGIITAIAVIVLTLVAAVIGGKVGHRYHNRVDRLARR